MKWEIFRELTPVQRVIARKAKTPIDKKLIRDYAETKDIVFDKLMNDPDFKTTYLFWVLYFTHDYDESDPLWQKKIPHPNYPGVLWFEHALKITKKTQRIVLWLP